MTFYEIVKYIHVTAITLSISGFIIRVILKFNDSPYQTRYWFKKLPHKVDIVLLASALTMVYIMGINPLTTYWLGDKITIGDYSNEERDFIGHGGFTLGKNQKHQDDGRRCCRTGV